MRVGTPGRDVIYGIWQDEFISAGAGDDVLIGRSGSDLLLAGDGNDVVRAGGGRDEVVGGRGNDRFSARDRRVDLISGGPGFDSAWVDRRDRISAVERVYRAGRR
jgi:Ca2+-binding RTX toxin-like protein